MPQTTSKLDVDTIRADFPILQQLVNGKPLVYFDNGATTQRPQSVIDAVSDCYRNDYSNVHRGVHELSERATEQYESARRNIQRFINAASPFEVIFTSGTTASINLVAHSYGSISVGAGDEILITQMEHHSNIVPWQQLAVRTGAKVVFAPVTDDGRLDIQAFHSLLSPRTKLVAFTALSNVLGTINPVAELVEASHQVGAKVLIDAAQSVPHLPLDVKIWNADFVAFSGHKMLGPSGVGVLYGKQDLLEKMPPFLGGGSMISSVTEDGFAPGELPAKFEAGTPPIAQAIAMTAAIEYLEGIGVENIEAHEKELTIRAHQVLKEIDGLTILGPEPEQKGGVVSFVIDGVNVQDIATFINRYGIAIRPGHHCAMPLHKRLGVPASNRASFYIYNTLAEVDLLGEALPAVLKRLRG